MDREENGKPLIAAQDRVVGLVLLAAGAFLFAWTFTFRTVEWDPLGLAFWPRIVLGLLLAAGAYLAVRGRLDGGPLKALQPTAFLVLGGILAYALLLGPLGYLVATPLYIVAFHLALGGVSRRHVVEALISATVGTALVYYVFQEALLVQLPEGLFAEPL